VQDWLIIKTSRQAFSAITVANSKGSNNTRHIANHFKGRSALPKTRLSKLFHLFLLKLAVV